MPFYPDNASVPAELRTTEFLLRPLRGTDVELDYAALMASKAMLRQWSQSDWPSDEFTLAENLADLVEHQQEHEARVAFTYTVTDPEATICLGCVYIKPPGPLLAAEEPALFAADEPFRARCAFWAREPRLADDLDRRLLATLITWFQRDWAFSRVLFVTSEQDNRQQQIMAEAGLRRLIVKETADRESGKTKRWVVYGDR